MGKLGNKKTKLTRSKTEQSKHTRMLAVTVPWCNETNSFTFLFFLTFFCNSRLSIKKREAFAPLSLKGKKLL